MSLVAAVCFSCNNNRAGALLAQTGENRLRERSFTHYLFVGSSMDILTINMALVRCQKYRVLCFLFVEMKIQPVLAFDNEFEQIECGGDLMLHALLRDSVGFAVLSADLSENAAKVFLKSIASSFGRANGNNFDDVLRKSVASVNSGWFGFFFLSRRCCVGCFSP